jgi:POT family proton-dependent oligopeptide transporter
MSRGAAIVALSYVMLAAIALWSAKTGTAANWLWVVVFFVVYTAGELYILPIGLGLFGQMAPLGFNATTIAVWFLAAFAGNFLAGVLGAAWSRLSAAQFFVLTAAVAATSSVLLLLFDRSVRRQSAA